MKDNKNELGFSGTTYLLYSVLISLLKFYFLGKMIDEISIASRNNIIRVQCIKIEDVSTTNIPKIIRTYSDGYTDRSAYFQKVKQDEIVQFYVGTNGKRILKKNIDKVIALDIVFTLLVLQMGFYLFLCYKEKTDFEKYHKKRICFKKTIFYI